MVVTSAVVIWEVGPQGSLAILVGQMGDMISWAELSHAELNNRKCVHGFVHSSLIVCTFPSLNLPPGVVNLFSWLGKLTLHRKHAGKKKHWCRPRAVVFGDTTLLSVIALGGGKCSRGAFLGLSWALIPFFASCHSLGSLLLFIHNLPPSPSSTYLETNLPPANLADHSNLFLPFSLPNLSSFRSSQQCSSCYQGHLWPVSRTFL